MSYSDAAYQLLESVQEYAEIYHRLQILQVKMIAAWMLLVIASVMVAQMYLIPRLRTLRKRAGAEVIKNEVKPEKPRRIDIEDILKEFES